jgi:hypothetical protein
MFWCAQALRAAQEMGFGSFAQRLSVGWEDLGRDPETIEFSLEIHAKANQSRESLAKN